VASDSNDVVEVDGTGSANLDGVSLALARRAVLGLGVHAADALRIVELGGVLPEQPDVPVLGPRRLPRVPDQPVVLAALLVSSVPDERHGVVHLEALGVEADLEDAALVRLPGTRGDADGDGACLGDGVEEGEVVVGGELGAHV